MSLSRKGLLDEMGLSPQWVLREASPNAHEMVCEAQYEPFGTDAVKV